MLEIADGFDTYTTSQMARRYGTGVNGATIQSPGFGSIGEYLNCPANDTDLFVTLGGAAEYYVGFDLNPSSVFHNEFFRFTSNGVTDLCVLQNQAGVLNTNFGNATAVSFIAGNWHAVQAHLVISPTAGVLEVKVDGVVVLNLTGLNTGTTNIGVVALCTHNFSLSGQTNSFDNFWVFNTSGSHSNGFPTGRISIQVGTPNADGTYTAWTPNSGSNHFSRVADATSDDDTSYVSDLTAGDRDSYTITPLTGSIAAVHGVIATAVYRKDDVDSKILHLFVKSGSTITESPDLGVPLTYTSSSLVLPEDPNTSAQWLSTNVDAIEIGVKVIS
jgi:hypothetical protein